MTTSPFLGTPDSPPTTLNGDVFVLGAGFSRAAAPEMPLLTELPQVLKGFRRGWNSDLQALFERLGSNVETLLTYLAQPQPFLGESQNLRNRASFLDVARTLGWAISECQDRATRSGNTPTWLAQLVTKWDESWNRHFPTTVLTFNYDTLVEKVFQQVPAVSAGPSREARPAPYAQHLFVVPLTSMASRDGTGLVGGDERRSFTLLKLHGSMNWFYSGRELFYGETIYYIPVGSGWRADDIAYDYSHGGVDKTPLVVPPTTEKSPFFTNETVRAQWEHASFALTAAGRVFFVGYSLPETDMLVRFLLAELRPETRAFVVGRLSSEHGRSDDDVRAEFVARYRRVMPTVEHINTIGCVSTRMSYRASPRHTQTGPSSVLHQARRDLAVCEK